MLSSYWSHSSSQKMDGQDDYTEFEACIHKSTAALDEQHHKQSRSSQVNFAQPVQGMVKVIEEMGNLFMEEINKKKHYDWTQETLLIQL